MTNAKVLVVLGLLLCPPALGADGHVSKQSFETSMADRIKTTLLPTGWTFLNSPAPVLPPLSGVAVHSGVSGDVRSEDASLSRQTALSVMNVGTTQKAPDATGLWLPLGELTPVSAFREGRSVVIVAAGKHVLDTTGLVNDGPFRSLSSKNLPDVTVITIGLADDRDVVLTPAGPGWSMTTSPDAKPQGDMLLGQVGSGLTFTPPLEDGAPKVVAIADPISGRRLLLGMTRSGRIQRFMNRRGAGFEVRTSLVGVVVAADSDALELRQADGVLILDTAGPASFPLLASDRLQPYGASLSGVSLGPETSEDLRQSLRRAMASAARATPGERFDARLRVAQAAARLGQGPLMAEVLGVALSDWPEGIEKPQARRLQQIAAVLNNRPDTAFRAEEGGTIPEDQLWRGLVRTNLWPSQRQGELASAALSDDRRKTADLIAVGLPVLETYAAPLRRRLLSPAANWVVRYGSDDAVKAIDGLKDFPELELSKALLAARRSVPDAGKRLAGFAKDPSPVIWPVAAMELLRLQLRQGKIDPQIAANKLEGLFLALRIAGQERDGRLLQMEALQKAGNWSAEAQATEAWRRLYPDNLDPIRPVQHQTLARMAQSASDNAQKNASDLALLEEALKEVSDDGERRLILEAIERRYSALDLPDEQRRVLEKLLTLVPETEKATLRVQLAELDVAKGDVKDARGDLSGFTAGSPAAAVALPDGTRGQAVEVALLQARIAIADHRPDEALQKLAAFQDPRVSLLRADIAEQRSEWSKAVSALLPMLKGMPVSKMALKAPFSQEQQSLVMRIGSDASRASDQQTLDMLRERFLAFMAGTPSKAVFKLLVGDGRLKAGSGQALSSGASITAGG